MSAALAMPRAARVLGYVLAIICVIAPALKLGPLFAQPPLPMAALWLAFGRASDATLTWSTVLWLAGLGLLHDQLAYGPYGLYAALYLSAYVFGRIAATLVTAPTLYAQWGGFILTCVAVTVFAAIIAPMALGAGAKVWTFAQAATITALLFPLARPLYLEPR
jgi:cell shape-determining protein MreD